MRKRCIWPVPVLVSVLLFLFVEGGYCGKGGHYTPGISGIRDFIMPQKSGLYFAEYTPYYYTNAYYGNNAKKMETLTVDKDIYINNTPFHVTADADIDLKIESVGTSPLIFYVFGADILGAKYGITAGTYYGYVRTKIKTDTVITGIEGEIVTPDMEIKKEIDVSGSGIGDLTILPFWLNWDGEHYDAWIVYGFYAPTGKYDSKKYTNIGRGFWSHEISIGAAYYPQKERATAFVGNLAYEINMEQEETDVTPGQNIGLEYGISHYINPRFEVGISGYSLFQVTNDSGGNTSRNIGKSYVHGIGGQMSYWIVQNKFCVAGKYLCEYAAKDRTRGQLATINLYFIF